MIQYDAALEDYEEDIGVDLGDKYRDVDPTSPLSLETVIANEHVFENGICTARIDLSLNYVLFD